MADFYNKTVDLYGRQFLVLKIIIAVIVILSIFNTISMSVWERTKEIGTIMAMGFKKWEIMRLFLLEGFVLGVIGGILGTLGGCILAYVISLVGIPMRRLRDRLPRGRFNSVGSKRDFDFSAYFDCRSPGFLLLPFL